jgi:predicted cytidylate kinase
MAVKRITLSGTAGCGKSSVGKPLAQKLGFEFISVGNFSREYADSQYGIDIIEFQEYLKTHPEIDHEIDKKFGEECSSKENIVVDYRLGFHFIKNAFHVFLKVSDEVALERLLKAKRLEEFKTEDQTVIFSKTQERNKNMRNRFIETYGVDFTKEDNFDLVIDTDNLTIDQVVEYILHKIN